MLTLHQEWLCQHDSQTLFVLTEHGEVRAKHFCQRLAQMVAQFPWSDFDVEPPVISYTYDALNLPNAVSQEIQQLEVTDES